MAVVLTLQRRRRKPRGVGAVIIDHMVSLHPQQLVALVEVELGQRGLVPPVALLSAAAAALHVVGGGDCVGALAAIDFESSVWRDEWCVRPIGLHSASLRGPVISIPNGAVNTHGLILRKGDSFMLQVRMHSNWGLIYQESVDIYTYQYSQNQYKLKLCALGLFV